MENRAASQALFTAAGLKRARFWFAAISIALCAGAPPTWAASTTTTLAVTSSGSAVTTVASGSVVTLTATVKAGSTAVHPGQVNFCDATAAHCTDIHLLGTAQLTSAGTAIMKFRPGIGSHSYKAVFLRTNSDAGSVSGNSALTVTGKHATTTTIAQSSSTFDNYTLTATVTGSEWTGAPTGKVSFLDTSNGDAVLGTAELGAGTTEISLANPQTVNLSEYGANSIAIADFNGDGIPDFATAIEELGYATNGTVVAYLGNGDGSFTPASSLTTGAGGAVAIVSADFNNDGKTDLAVTNYYGTVTILLGNGDGTFTQESESPTTSNGNSYLAVADFNQDGNLDLALADNATGSVAILLGNGDGTFKEGPAPPKLGSGLSALATGDFNGDGKADLAVSTCGTPPISVLLGNGDGTFTLAPNSSGALCPEAIAVADFNGDGKLDLALATERSDGALQILLGNGDGTFTSGTAPSGDDIAYSITFADFNQDGIPDLALGIHEGGEDEAGSAELLLGKGDGTFAVATSWQPTNYGSFFAMAAADLNGDGVPDLVVEDIEENPDNGAAILLTQLTQTATATASNITLPVNTGTHQVEASYPGDTNYSSSVSGTTGLSTGQLSFTTTNVAFGNEEVGDSTEAFPVYLTNSSSSTQTIHSIKLGGANPGDFATSNTCGTSLAAGAECQIGVRFIPQTPGALAATISLTDSATNSPQTITISGTGVNSAEATVSLSSTSLQFTPYGIGVSSAPQAVYVTNTSSATIYFHSITLGGTNASSFVTSNTCNGPTGGTVGGTLAPGAHCQIGVRMVPATSGYLSAAITVSDNTPTSPQIIMLTGSGR